MRERVITTFEAVGRGGVYGAHRDLFFTTPLRANWGLI